MKPTAFVLFLVLTSYAGSAETPTRTIMVNGAGYTTASAKYCLMPNAAGDDFSVVKSESGEAVFSARVKSVSGDWGVSYRMGEFTALQIPGSYIVRSGSESSHPFDISDRIYDPAIQKVLQYFSTQRCGDSRTGYNAPCHLEDGIRVDNRQPHDASGGWHDACDLRKWCSATIYGVIGLAKAAEAVPTTQRTPFMDELRWGNAYFLKMQEPAGYLMDHCAGDVFEHGDQNHWTDNVAGTSDDRLIQTRALGATGQFNFIMAEAMMARLTELSDPGYSKQCLDAALRCLDWLDKQSLGRSATDLGAGIAAMVELHKLQPEARYENKAVVFAKRLMDLQHTTPISDEAPIRGFFYRSPDSKEPLREIAMGCWPLLSLTALVEHFPTHADAPRWKESISLYCREYLLPLSQRTPFGIVPYGLYIGSDPGGNRKIGSFWYRWFMEPNRDWWVGINANLASSGVGLLQASRVLKDERLAAAAQRQLDWILGVNPFRASTMMGVGRNHPAIFKTSEFKPETPLIPGAVMNGIGGWLNDKPDLKAGSWQTCEYWTPMVAYTAWLMTELHSLPYSSPETGVTGQE